MRWSSLQLALLAAFLLAAESGAQGVARIPAVRLTQPITIDGAIDEVEWASASKLEGFSDPVVGRPVKDATIAFLAYDDEAIYVAFRCFDSQPEGIVAREVQEGADIGNDDRVIFEINPYGSRLWEGRSNFAVSAGNVRREQISGGRTSKREWRGIWQSAVRRLSDGYSVEMRIPWKVLDYPDKRPLDMDVNFGRVLMRTREDSRWRNAVQNFRPENEPIWEAVMPPKRQRSVPMDVLVFGSPEWEDGKLQFRAGLDARIKPTLDTTAMLTLFPDFRNIESQVEGIGFTRTERFVEESRPFFTEGSDFFGLTGSFTFGRAFYSRRIAEVDMGAKFFGRITPQTAVGALATTSPDQDAAVVRVAHSPNSRASVSAFATYSRGIGRANSTVGGTFSVRQGNLNVDGQTMVEQPSGREANGASAVALSYDAPNVFAILRHEWVEPDIEAPLGFIPWRDRVGAYLFVDTWRDFRRGPLRNAGANLYLTHFRTYGDEEQEKGAEFSFGGTLRNDLSFNGGYSAFRYFGSPERSIYGGFTVNSSNRFRRLGLNFTSGKREGEDYRFVSLNTTRRVLRRVDLGLASAYSRLGEEEDRQQILTLGVEIDKTRSLTGRVVIGEQGTNAYVAYRNSGGKGLEWYVILGDPNETETQARIAVKLVFAR